jgi:cytochrome c oxidase subunit 1
VGGLLQASFWSMLAGVLLTGFAMATNRATVLYTSYAPLQAHWTYYTGLVLVVISTWLAAANMFISLSRWRKEHPGERIPLLTFISVTSWAMWVLASAGVAVSFLGFLIPWSLGVLPRVDPLLNRTLFWFTGHAIVYAWLLPAYVSWYALVPRQAGGKLFSDSLTRTVFLIFLIVSVPTGLHHQYTDPGISTNMKAFQGVITFVIFWPSLATAFSVMAALEIGGRRRGGRGLLGWIRALPWGDPSLVAQLLAMLTFVLGGVTGLVNASYTVNQVIHNTTWVPGHFHMTVGSAVALTFMGIAYWLVPYLTGRGLWSRRLALVQSWTYTIGVFVFARGMISGGLAGMPRRTFIAQATYTLPAWHLPGIITAVGGSLMFIGAMLFIFNLIMTVAAGSRTERVPRDVPYSEVLTAPARTGWEVNLDRLRWWVLAAVVLIVIAYAPAFMAQLPPYLVSPGYRVY